MSMRERRSFLQYGLTSNQDDESKSFCTKATSNRIFILKWVNRCDFKTAYNVMPKTIIYIYKYNIISFI